MRICPSKDVTNHKPDYLLECLEKSQYGEVLHRQQSRMDHTEKMNNTTIEHYLSSRCRGQIMGVFSSDTLPTSMKKRPAIIVCNTDLSDRSGEHWICIYIDINRCREFFDSFGRRPCQPFCSFIDKYCMNWTYNDRQLQHILSSLCGVYCVFFAIFKSYGHDRRRIVCAFTDYSMLNDRIMVRFIRKVE